MPSFYVGDPTASQAPGPQPGPQRKPVGRLPSDEDPPNAATFEQPYMEALDFIAWMNDPFALTGAGELAKPIHRYRNVRLQDRFRIDHMGFPGGDIYGFCEYWTGKEQLTSTGSHTFEKTVHRWTGNTTLLGGAATGIDMNGLVRCDIGIGTGADIIELIGDPVGAFGDSSGMMAETRMTSFDSVIGGQKVFFGLRDPERSTFYTAPVGAYFYKGDGDTNWQCACSDGTAVTTADSHVEVLGDHAYSLRVEYTGSFVADGGAEASEFYVNGVHVATITTNLPGSTFGRASVFFGLKQDGGTSPRTWGAGPTRFYSNLV